MAERSLFGLVDSDLDGASGSNMAGASGGVLDGSRGGSVFKDSSELLDGPIGRFLVLASSFLPVLLVVVFQQHLVDSIMALKKLKPSQVN